MAKETAIAYGIEFYVGRRSRDRAVSDIRAAGEMVNQQALKAYKQGAAQRQAAHEEAVGKLHKSSEKAIKKLADSRKRASKQAAATFESLKPPTPEDYAKGRNLSTEELKEYTDSFNKQIRSMDNSLSGFAKRAGDLGMEFEGTDVDSVMKGFSEGDAQARKAGLEDQQATIARGEKLIRQKKEQRDLQAKIVKDSTKEQLRLQGKLKTERATLRGLKKGSVAYKKQLSIVQKLERQQTKNNKILEDADVQLKKTIKSLEEQVSLTQADKDLLVELKRLHSEVSAQEIRTGKKVRENKEKERKLDKELADKDRKAIRDLKEQNRLMSEYARHIDEAAAKISGTLKNAFVVGTAAVAALNYKLMSVVEGFKDFEAQLVNANSIWQESNDTLFAISDSVVEFGTRYGVSMENATAGLYQYASAGVEANQAMEMLQHTLKLSMAVQGDHNTLSKLTTQTIMGFNLEFSEAEQVTDKFAHAINKSLIEWDDLASSVKFALPFFTSTGQSIDQLLGGLQVLTNRALEAGIAGRGLRQALAEFTQHAEDNSAAFRKLGIDILDLEGNMKPLNVIAKDFNNTLGEQASDMEMMITLMEDLNVRGATAFVHLAQNADEFTAAVNDLQNSTGAATAMAEVQQESLSNQIQVVKNALMAPFLLSDEIGKEAGYLNKFALEIHGIVDVVESLFIQKMDDGSVALTKMGATMRDFVIGALHQAKDILVILVDIVQEFAGSGNDLTGMIKAMAIPLKLVAKILRFFGSGLMETVILFKLMNGLLPINSALLAKNYGKLANSIAGTASMVSWKGKDITVTQAQQQLEMLQQKLNATTNAGWKTRYTNQIKDIQGKIGQAKATQSLTGSVKGLIKSQMFMQGAMMGMMFLTQRVGRDSIGAAAAIGALAGAFMGLSFAMNMAAAAEGEMMFLGLKGGSGYAAAIGLGALAGASFNMLMQQMMKPPDIEMPSELTSSEIGVMDMGGRFMASRSYDMGGRYTQEHGLAVLKDGETVIPKTQNMLGSGITLNMGDVHVQDGEDFADRVALALPSALRRVDETGGL